MIKTSKNSKAEKKPAGEESIKQAGEPFTPETSPNDLKGDKDPAQESEEELRADLEKARNEYLYLFSEFDNYKKRTLKERIELMKTASQDVIISMLPVLDDFDRAVKSLDESGTDNSVLEGMKLIHNKFVAVLEQKGLRRMESVGEQFNTDFHEAVTKVPAQDGTAENTIIDEAECGYLLNEKVIRHAKVIVAG